LPVVALFADRHAAGEAVAESLSAYAGRPDVIVLGMPRGGVVVAKAVADALHVPLDVVIARKLGVPGLAEVALGAIAAGIDHVVPDKVAGFIGVPRHIVDQIAEQERVELRRRAALFCGGRSTPDLRGRTVIIVDDGFATGATLRAAAEAVRRQKPRRIVAAVPVGSGAHCDDVRASVDELVVLMTPDPFTTVSAGYEEFAQVSDGEVLTLLGGNGSRERRDAEPGQLVDEREVIVPMASGAHGLTADLGTPDVASRGLVIFAHGGGSSRNSYRNRYLAGRLRMAGWSTLRVDLLTEREQDADDDGDFRFDVERIGGRLRAVVEWAVRERVPGSERIVLFGASTGAAAAVFTAAACPDLVSVVVSRGGRVDLAGRALERVRCPVLMIVGSRDPETLNANRQALLVVRDARLKLISGAGHTFEEPGTLGAAGEVVARWLGPRSFRELWNAVLSRA
jgi:putative phosphoribosyl transferase